MSKNLKFDFIIDMKVTTLTIRREFLAKRQLIWDCYTKSDYLEEWFAPDPLTAKTKEMDFKEGGFWIYAMVEPNGTEHWGRTDFKQIKPIDFYTSLDGFSDENGNLNPDLPCANWLVTFKDFNGNSLVESVVTYSSLNDLETVVNMGMEDGIKSVFEKLDKLLLKLNLH